MNIPQFSPCGPHGAKKYILEQREIYAEYFIHMLLLFFFPPHIFMDLQQNSFKSKAQWMELPGRSSDDLKHFSHTLS